MEAFEQDTAVLGRECAYTPAVAHDAAEDEGEPVGRGVEASDELPHPIWACGDLDGSGGAGHDEFSSVRGMGALRQPLVQAWRRCSNSR
jgi:hypothetical protein